MTTELDTLVKCLADGVANDILIAGSAYNGKATRIALKVGDGSGDTSKEKDNGGLCEQALTDVITESLRRRLGT